VLAFTLFEHACTRAHTYAHTGTHNYLAESISHSSSLDLTIVVCFAQEFPWSHVEITSVHEL